MKISLMYGHHYTGHCCIVRETVHDHNWIIST